MIIIESALNIIKANTTPLLKETKKQVEKAGGYKLCKDVYAPINMPPFRQSAMDGYAVCLHDKQIYNVIDEIKAGDNHQPILKKGDAVRIFTGAPVPDTANCVIMQEKVMVNGKSIKITDPMNLQDNIRSIGEQVKKGQVALKKDTKLTPAAIGYLSSLGITEVAVYKKPQIAIITTGNELVEAGTYLEYGQIYESNSKMLLSALYSLKFYEVTIHNIKDDYQQTVKALSKVIENNDLLLITGGISVGDYDFVGKALAELKVEELFYKVKQKPGKPFFFGKKESTLVFALPGNPAASLTCFYMYVYVSLQKLINNEREDLQRVQAKSASKFIKRGDRPQFLKAIYNNGNVEILEGQSSAMQQTFALSNALVFVSEEQTKIKINDIVETILLPV
ncbi:molybdopterin molybdotransferase MoeA [Siansivirga zeaxanthinifaciens]|uniref:Molybdopterin molybdenumtransferase n=1 Tax=Siansivirga zeaxanthinifaciens CC-SAMT-1 TaxID=1454006 RepID=A0A0C5VYE1_9FLAO|nr:gephyrin-like molybdotransferase Glp [Siansivirga zeaxanthinifaciens]AJR04096.1 molybdenum cofactor biosynthesis protein [Siansivirga zeaxanthinifaciens CC-SAMT-1]